MAVLSVFVVWIDRVGGDLSKRRFPQCKSIYMLVNGVRMPDAYFFHESARFHLHEVHSGSTYL